MGVRSSRLRLAFSPASTYRSVEDRAALWLVTRDSFRETYSLDEGCR